MKNNVQSAGDISISGSATVPSANNGKAVRSMSLNAKTIYQKKTFKIERHKNVGGVNYGWSVLEVVLQVNLMEVLLRKHMNIIDRKKIIADVLAGIVILIGTKIPELMMNIGFLRYYDDDTELLYAMEYLLSSTFLFIFTLFMAHVIIKIFNKKYRKD